jgi:peptidyl-prolyl cis-trans isomerase D
MRQNIMLAKLYERVAGSLTLTDEQIKEEYRKANEETSIYYIASLYSDFAKDVSASVEESKDYFLANPLEFKQPLSFNIEYMVLTLDEQDTKEIKDKIKDLLLRLTNKEDFKKVAQDFKLSVKETGLFKQTDSIPGIGWSEEIIHLISKARADEILPPIHLDKNYYLIKLKERKEPYIPDFEQVKDQVKEAVTKDKSQKIAKEKIDNCLAKLKAAYQSNSKSVNFDKIANQCGLKSDATGLFKYGSYIEGIGASDNFWLESQKLKDEEFSEIIEVPSGFYIIKPKSKIPVDEKQFQKDKKEFTESLLTQKKNEYFAQFEKDLIHKSQN